MSAATKRTIRLCGVPMDLGAGRRGVDMGPSAIRLAGLRASLEKLGHEVIDDGNLGVPSPESQELGDPSAKYLSLIYHVCNRLRLRVMRALAAGHVPLVMGGDHSIAVGTIAGVSEFHRNRGEEIGLIWVDAHADMNTPETSPSGNVHGMPLACVLGMGPRRLAEIGGFQPKVDRRKVALIGLRNLDEREKDLVRRSGVNAYTMRDLDERGMRAVAADAIERASGGTVGFHLSFDLDGMDPIDAPGVGTPVKGGINWREANLLMEMISDSGRMTSMEITELNPILDVRNETGKVAVEMALSAFGKSIL
jgi:arginase